MDVIDRLHEAVRESGIPKKRIAHLAGMSQSELSRLLNHHLESPSVYDIEAVARAIGLTMETLFADPGSRAKDVAGAREALHALTRFVDAHDIAVPRTAPVARKKRPSRRARIIPVAATPNVELYGGDGPRIDIPSELWDRGVKHAARVIGNSMIDAGIDPGEIVFFRPAANIASARGKIVICRVGTGIYLKRLERVGDEVRLLSENEGYKPITVRRDDDFELYGVVVFPAK